MVAIRKSRVNESDIASNRLCRTKSSDLWKVQGKQATWPGDPPGWNDPD
jgi:hypothetical protein